jgi:uncharacterized membrane protein
MNKITLKTEVRAFIIILATIALSYWAYPQLPSQVASHWNFQGQINGWSGKNFHSFFFPGVLIFMYLLFLVLPYLDPKKARYTEFAKVYRLMRDAIMFVLLGVFAVATFQNLNYNLNVGAIVSSLIGALMIFIGNYLGKLKRNWFIGLRTPWSLSSENVWNKTHRVGGRLFMIWGLGLIIAPWINFQIAMIIVIGGIAAIVIGINIYSFLLYRKEQKK